MPKTISIQELQASRAEISLLRLLSVELGLYLVEVEVDDQTLRVTDDQGQALVFRSQLAAKQPFKKLSVKKAVLRHESAYDEMVGLPAGGENVMEVTIALPADDYS